MASSRAKGVRLTVKKPTPGVIVDFVLRGGPYEGQVRPAIVIAPCEVNGHDECKLHVLINGDHDLRCGYSNSVPVAPYDAAGAPGSWKWPP